MFSTLRGAAEGALVMVDAFTVEVVEGADGVAIVALVGELDVVGARVLEEHLTRLSSRVWCVRFDASRLEFMAAAGLHCILGAERRFGRGRVTVHNPPRLVRKVLAICDLLHLLQAPG